MSKLIVIECSYEKSDRLAEQIKDIVAEHEYQPFRGPGKVYEFGPLRIDQPKQEVTIDGNLVSLSRREFEILGLFASYPNQTLTADFLHNVVWPHPDPEHGEEEVMVYIESLQKKLQLDEPHSAYRITSENTQSPKGYQATFLVK